MTDEEFLAIFESKKRYIYKMIHNARYKHNDRAFHSIYLTPQDIFQECRELVWRNRHKCTDEGNTVGWVINACKWAITNTLRLEYGNKYCRANVSEFAADPHGLLVWTALAHSDSNVEDSVTHDVALDSVRDEIWKAVNQLPPEQRRYVIAKYKYGATPQQLKKAFGPNYLHKFLAVKTGARARLKEQLEHLRELIV